MNVEVRLLAEVPDLMEPVGRLRHAEFGGVDTVDEWIATTRLEAGRVDLPVTWVAIGETGDALGTVGLGTSDVPDRPELVPCVWGMVVRPDLPGSRARLRAGLCARLRAGLRARIPAGLRAQLRAGLRALVRAGLRAQLRAGLRARIRAGLRALVRAELRPECG